MTAIRPDVAVPVDAEGLPASSGIDWFAGVPEHWSIQNVKGFGSVTLGKMLQSESKSGNDVAAAYLRAANVQPDGVLALADIKRMWFAPREVKALDLQSGDVVVVEGGIGGYGRAAFLPSTLEGVGFQNSINRIRPFDGNDGRYMAYLLQNAREVGYLAAYCNVVSMPHLTAEKLAALTIPIPPPAEQRAIADYLDAETDRIDALFTKQVRLVERLRERRAALITNIATQGIDQAPLKPTGNTYIPMIPSHWTLSHFGLEMVINSGQVDPEYDPWRDTVLIAPNHLVSGLGQIVGRETAAEQGASSGKYRAYSGQIVYSKIRPGLNKVAIAPEDCLCSADMYAMSSLRGDDHRYLLYYMLSRPFHAYASMVSARVKMPKINREELSAAPWLRPPLEEQRRVADYLDEQTAKIDALISKTERFSVLARERRAALVTAAVTGKIDVRTAATEVAV